MITKNQYDAIHKLVRKNPNISSFEIARQIGLDRTTVQKWRNRDKYGELNKASDERIQFTTQISRSKTLVFTWAQNATPRHKGFLKALQAFQAHRNADLHIIPGRYKNPTSIWSESQANEEWWDKELQPYLTNQRVYLNSNLVLLGDVKTQPTDATPLSEFHSITHSESAIVGHPKLQFTVIPTPQNQLPKILTTTGAITVRNYTDSKAGKKGDFHHIIGACVVELATDGTFHLRQINARPDGAFCDLDYAYYPSGKVAKCGPYLGLVFGDAHPRFADPEVVKATFGKNGLVERLNPKELVFHDLMDSYSVNPHHRDNPFIAGAKYESGLNLADNEVQDTIDWLIEKTGSRKAVVVRSNHDDMLKRWIISHDWKTDPANQIFYLKTALYMRENTKMMANGVMIPDPFIWWAEQRVGKNINMLKTGQKYSIGDILVSLHGDQGPAGVKGTLKNLSKIGVKVISGHSHSPGIEAGHYRTGTMTYLGLEYTGPVSNWLNTHIGINPMGKRVLFTCINGRFWK